MLPIGGLLIAVFCGWLLPSQNIQETFGWNANSRWLKAWRWINRYIAPIAIVLILLGSLGVFNHL